MDRFTTGIKGKRKMKISLFIVCYYVWSRWSSFTPMLGPPDYLRNCGLERPFLGTRNPTVYKPYFPNGKVPQNMATEFLRVYCLC